MLTLQKLQKEMVTEQNLLNYLIAQINSFQSSPEYINAVENATYYNGENVDIA